jgi:DNA-directed RNA polymerase specialized sigma24 family protein
VSTAIDDSLDLIRRALAGDGVSMRALVDRLSPFIEHQVLAMLWKRRLRGRDVRQELRDLTQAVFLSLFESNGKALRAWDPSRDIPLERFVSFLARRQVVTIMRNGRTALWPDEPTDPEVVDAASPSSGGPLPEQIVASREHLQLLLEGVREQLSPTGLEMFYRLVVNEETPEQVGAVMGKSLDAVYKWRSRLALLIREVAGRMSEAAGEPRMTEGTAYRR